MQIKTKSIVSYFTSFLLSVAITFGYGVFQIQPVKAAAIMVTTTTDNETNDAECTLREAIIAANTDAAYRGCAAGNGDDTITFEDAGGTYLVAPNETFTSTHVVTTNITIIGQGQGADDTSNTVIDGNWQSGIFNVDGPYTLTLQELRVTRGYMDAINGSGPIEGINGGNLILTNVSVVDAQTYGGAVRANGNITITGSTISNNDYDGNDDATGGGVRGFGTINITNSTITGNYGTDVGVISGTISGSTMESISLNGANALLTDSVVGGDNTAVFIGEWGGTVRNSTITGSTYGIAISGGVTTTITNTTITNNILGGMGYAVYVNAYEGWPSNVTLTNVTVAGNNVDADSPAIILDSFGTLTLKNTLISNSGGDNCSIGGTLVDGGNNLEYGSNTCGFSVNNNDIIGENPLLLALDDNGGSTSTMALQDGSPAINAGNDAFCTATDQIGQNRVGVCDIGAFESQSIQEGPPDSPPALTEVTPVPTPTNSATPSYTFNSTEAGTITYGGNCSSDTTVAVAGDNTITFNALVSGTYNDCTVTVTDAALNASDPLPITSFTVDTQAPSVTNVTSSTPNATYKAGDEISIRVVFSSAVNVTGTPQLTLETGNTDAVVDYSEGTGTDTLTFDYTVGAGENTPNLDYAGTSALALNGGSIKDTALNEAILTLATPGEAGSLGANKMLVVDTTIPTLTEVTPVPTPTNSATPSYTFNSTEAGTITYGGSCASDTASAVSGDNTVTFNTLVSGTYNDCTVTVTDAALNASDPLPITSFTVDTQVPSVTNVTSSTPNATYKAGDEISIQVVFSSAVNVTGTPQLTLETGNTDAVVNYSEGTGTDTLTFNYTVGNGENTLDLDYAGISALALNGGDIKDAALNEAILTLTTPGEAGSLGANKMLVVDGVAPAFTGVNPLSGSSINNVTDASDVQYSLSEAVASGTITITQTGGVDDLNSPHECSLTGNALNAGEHILDLSDIIDGCVAAVTLVDGAIYTFSFNATDAAGNPADAVEKTSVQYDATSPVFSDIAPSSDSSIRVSDVTYTLSEGVANGTITFSRSGGTEDPDSPHVCELAGADKNGGTHVANCTFSLVEEAIYTLTLTGTDAAGNTGSSTNSGIRFDNIRPFVTISSTAISPTNASSIPVTVEFSEEVTGFTLSDITTENGVEGILNGDGSTYSFNVTPAQDGTVTIAIGAGVAEDIAGNINNAATSLTLESDRTPPVVSNILPLEGATIDSITEGTDLAYTLSEAVTEGTVVFSRSGGANDAQAPHTCTLTGTALGIGEHVLDVSDAVNGCTENLTLADGTVYDLNFQVADQAGNTSTYDRLSVIYDITAPIFSAVTPLGDSYITNVTDASEVEYTLNEAIASGTVAVQWESGSLDVNHTCSLTGNSKTSGIHTIDFSDTVNGCSTAFSLVSGATYTFIFNGTDAGGNPAVTVTRTGVTFDDAPPVLSMVSAIPAATSDSTPDMTFNTTEAGTLSYEGTCTSLTVNAASGPNTITYAEMEDGTYNDCTVVVTDAAGNSSDVLTLESFLIDTTRPSIIISSNVTSPTNANSIPVTITFSEPVTGFGSGDIQVENGAKGAVDGDETAYTFHITPTGDGPVTVDIAEGVAVDVASNTNTAAAQFSIVSDRTAPILTQITPIASATVNTTPVYTFSSDEEGDIAYSSCLTVNEPLAETTILADESTNVNFGPLSAGETSNGCAITVTDSAGNVSEPLSVSNFSIVAPMISGSGYLPKKTLLHKISDAIKDVTSLQGATIVGQCKGKSCRGTSINVEPMSLKREEALVMIKQTFNMDFDARIDYCQNLPLFKDTIADGSDRSSLICFMKRKGVITGYIDTGEFLPEKNVTQAEFLAMLLRNTNEARAIKKKSRWGEIWYKSYINFVQEKKILIVDDPNKPIDQQEALEIIEHLKQSGY